VKLVWVFMAVLLAVVVWTASWTAALIGHLAAAALPRSDEISAASASDQRRVRYSAQGRKRNGPNDRR
jgi:hypothetical protein